jgi:hypothetical protein
MTRGFLNTTGAQTLLLDCSRFQTFALRLQTNVQTLWLTNIIPGMLYVFLLIQDEKGGHTFNWGGSARFPPVDTRRHSVTVATFVGTAGFLQWVTPATWNARWPHE